VGTKTEFIDEMIRIHGLRLNNQK